MSEFQYYEFRAVDQPLTAEQMKRLRIMSSRASITPTSFVNTYNWGDFKGNPDRLIEDTFDAFVYFANWGTRRLALRLPNSADCLARIQSYCVEPSLAVRASGDSLVVEFLGEDVVEDYLDEEADSCWMTALLALREDLLRGDYRSLYLGWILAVHEDQLDDDESEPPVPPGLAQQCPALTAFCDYFDLNPDLVAAASAASEEGPAALVPARSQVAAWVASLPGPQKDAMLCAAAFGERPALGAELLRLYHASQPTRTWVESTAQPRTVAQLQEAARARKAQREREAAQKAEAAKRKKAAKQAAERAEVLDRLAKHEDATWDKVGGLIATTRPKDYDLAVHFLLDLRDLAVRDKREAEFQCNLRTIREENAKKPSLLRRLDEAGLRGGPA